MRMTAKIMFLNLAFLAIGALVGCNSKKVECTNCSSDAGVAQAEQVDAAPIEDAGATDQ